jgi:hypothetical protein
LSIDAARAVTYAGTIRCPSFTQFNAGFIHTSIGESPQGVHPSSPTLIPDLMFAIYRDYCVHSFLSSFLFA